MSSRRHLTIAILAALLVVGLGGLLLVWPSYRELAQINRQTEVLRNKGENYHMQVRSIARLKTEVDQAADQVAFGLKLIPESPGVADLMRILSRPLDGVHVRDQTFRAGKVREAVPGGGPRPAPHGRDRRSVRFDLRSDRGCRIDGAAGAHCLAPRGV